MVDTKGFTFRATFRGWWEEYQEHDGRPFEVVRVKTEATEEMDWEVVPMFDIRFTDIDKGITAWPEEVLTDEGMRFMMEHYPDAAIPIDWRWTED